MKIILTILILKLLFNTTNAEDAANNNSNATEEFYNIYEVEPQLLLWKNLFDKVNRLLRETEKVNNNFLDLNKKIDDVNKRQHEQEKEIQNIMQQINTTNSKLDMLTQNITSLLPKSDHKVGQNWTTILRRIDGTVNFNRNWTDYKEGFGYRPNGEFFIGLDKLHELTTSVARIELKVILKDWNDEERYAIYDDFQIGNETEKYKIKSLGKYIGDAGDSMTYHNGQPFSTIDKNEDFNGCAKYYQGPWWFYACYRSHLTGPYKQKEDAKTAGVTWLDWKGATYSYKTAEMLIRPML
ncbi:ficolin-2-like [Musca autumnalis]|uniref:ficolin-2-like n=1 Tax=Musca autumnalis TaxID=221902 RepID=UPI003CE9753C